MKTASIAGCTSALAPETLILWRAAELDAAAAARVATHVPTCKACQALLARYDATDAALRAYEPRPAVANEWQAMHARLTTPATQPSAQRRLLPTPGAVNSRARWRGVAAAAAVVLLVVGFWQVLGHLSTDVTQPGNRNTSSLTWQTASLPDGVGTPADLLNFELAVSPTDGNAAYFCAPVTAAPEMGPRVWETHDRGAHWAALAPVPITSPANICELRLDQLDPQIAVAVTFLAPNPNDLSTWPLPSSGQQFATFDGGKTWQPIPSDQGYVVNSLATWHGTTFAVRDVFFQGTDLPRLFASADHMRTWREIDGPIVASFAAYNANTIPPHPVTPPEGINQFWVLPASGELLAWTYPGELWQSTDVGAHWSEWQLPYVVPARVGTPAALAGPTPTERPSEVTGGFIVGPLAANAVPHVCAIEMANDGFKYQNGSPEQPLICTWDGGKTWQRRPQTWAPTTAHTCWPNCSSLAQYEVFFPQALALDDSILALADGGLYRLARNATSESQWTYLGSEPESAGLAAPTISVDPSAHRELMWAPAPGKVYTAEYPSGS